MNRFVMVMALAAATAISTAGQSFGQAPAPFQPGKINTKIFAPNPNPAPQARQGIFLLNTPPTPVATNFNPSTARVLAAPATLDYYTNNLYLGDVVIVEPDRAMFPDISVEDGIKILLTGGMALPPNVRV